MGNLSYLNKLGQHVGYTVLPNARTFKTSYKRSKGTALGLKDGYLVAIGLVSFRNHKYLNLMVRYRAGSPRDVIESTLKGLSTFRGLTSRRVKVNEDNLVVTWTYAFKKPSPDAVEKFIDEIIANIKGVALPLVGKCEDCGKSDMSEVTLVNGVPGYHCDGCRARTIAEKEREAEEYRNRPANYVVGLPVGALAAAITGTTWGLLISAIEAGSKTWTPQFHALAGVAVAGVVSWAMFKSTGKVDRVGQAIAIGLALGGKFWGDTLFYTFSLLHVREVTISTDPLSWSAADFHVFAEHLKFVAQRFWRFKLNNELGWFVLIADLFCAFSIAWMPWGKLPKFVPNYESAGQIQEASASASLSASAKLSS